MSVFGASFWVDFGFEGFLACGEDKPSQNVNVLAVIVLGRPEKSEN